ncbi:MAG: CIC family chloride channel protein [Planctomycetota bacterium]|jgi:CIC family chloride channel protein
MTEAPPSRSPLKDRVMSTLRTGRLAKWVLLSGTLGVLAGIVAWLFKELIHFCRHWLFEAPTGLTTEGLGQTGWGDWWIVFIPAAGGLVVGILTHTLVPEAEGHGTDSVIRAFHRQKGIMRSRIIALKALTSAITIGSGGSAGQEGPVAQVGGGLGSSMASSLGLSDRDRRLFVIAGASAGIGAMFSSPLGGALFMPEVLYRRAEFEGEAIIPCIVASTFAYTTFTAITGAHRAVDLSPALLNSLTFEPSQIWIYMLLGVICTVVGFLYTKTFYGVEALFKAMKPVHPILRPAIGGLLVGLLAMGIAGVGGENGILFGGYDLIKSSIEGSLTPKLIIILLLGKILATSLSVASGGSGGVFAPALAIGALVGAGVGAIAHTMVPGIEPGALALVGMGGFFAGVAKTPIASVVMVSEMTGGYQMLAPLMLVAVIHTLLSNRWTLYKSQVASPINSPAHAGDFVIDVLQSMKVVDVLGEIRQPTLIHEDVTLRGAMRIVAESHETHFPVIDDEGLVGIFSLTDLRRIFLEEAITDMVIVGDFMSDQVVTVRLDDSLHDVQRIMTRKQVSAVPVVDADNPRKVLALLERNAVGKAYNDKLAELKSS